MIEEILKYLSIFVFVFSLLAVARTIVKFIGSLLANPPKPLVLTPNEIVYNGLFFSYVITYLIIIL